MVKRKTKRWIIIGCILIIAIVAVLFVRNQMETIREQMKKASVDVEQVEKRNLVTSVSGTGKIVSAEIAKESVSLANVKVIGVNVEVGDKVKIGDVICTLDVDDIQESLDSAQESLDITNAQNNLNIASAENQLSSAEKAKKTTNKQTELSISTAKAGYEDAKEDLADAKKSLRKAKRDKTKAEKSIDSANKENGNANSDVFTTYEGAKTAVTSAESALKVAKRQRKTAYNNYQNALLSANSSKQTSSDNLKNQESSVDNSKLTAKNSTLTLKQQITNYKEQLEMGSVTASTDGTITSVNVEEGTTYSGGTIVTIEDTKDFVIETEIDEYEISHIKQNMDVVIKTDATGDEELEGTVIYVSDIASDSSSSSTSTIEASSSLTSQMGSTSSTLSSTSATYTVKIAFNQPNEMIRLGMSAKLSIVTEQKKDVLTVPYNAVEESEHGELYVTIQTSDDQTQKINVNVGMESDYYTEIAAKDGKDEITENTKVVVPSSESNASFEDMMQGRGPMGGF